METSSPIVTTCAKVAGFSGNERSCSRGHSVATAANIMASLAGSDSRRYVSVFCVTAQLHVISSVSVVTSSDSMGDCTTEFERTR